MGRPYRKVKKYGLKAAVADCLKRGAWTSHPHLEDRAAKRGLVLDDIEEALREGVVVEERYKRDNRPPDCWWYTFEKDVEGRQIRVVFYFLDDPVAKGLPHMVVYTCYERD